MTSDQRNYSHVLLAGTILILLFGVIRTIYHPEGNHQLIERVIVSAVGIAFVIGTYRSAFVRRYFYEILEPIAFIASLWFIKLIIQNDFAIEYLFGFMLMYVPVCIGFRYPKQLIWYSLMVVAVLGGADYYINGSLMNVHYALPIYASTSMMLLYILDARFRHFTERKLVEEKTMLQSAALSAAANAVVITRADGTIIWVNEAFTKLYGYTFEETIGNNPSLLKSGMHSEEFYKDLWKKIAKGDVWKGELINKGKDDRIHYEETTITPILNSFNQITHYIAIKNDVTSKKKTEKALRENQQLLTALFSQSLDGFYFMLLDEPVEWNKNTNKEKALEYVMNNERIVMANDAMMSQYGYKLEDILGKTPKELYYYNYEQAKVGWRKLYDNGRSHIETYERKANGQPLWIEGDYICIYDDEGRVRGHFGIQRDISERKKTEEAIKQAQQRLELHVKQTPLGVIEFDLNMNITAWNPSAEQIFGYTQEEMVGKDARIIIPEDIQGLMEETWEKLVTKQGGTRGVNKNIRKDGELITCDWYNTPLVDKHGRVIGIASLVQDITNQKDYEEGLIFAKEKAEESDRLKSEFLAQVSHEIRTPINVILSFSSLMKVELEGIVSEDLNSGFQAMSRAGKRIIRTIDLILNMSEVQTGTYEYVPRTINLYDEVLKNSYQEFKQYAKEKGLQLNLHNNIENPIVKADEYTINQIFGNLIDNAIKYTKEGKIDIHIKDSGNGSIITEVTDTGIGISKEYLEKLFIPFTQEEQGYTRKFEGNGLGLALVRSYCELNSAKIEVESEKGIGSTFRVIFNKYRSN